MTRINKKWFKEFLFSNLDDCEISTPNHLEIPVFDLGQNKWINNRSDSFLTLNKKEYLSNVVIPDETRALMLQPEFIGDIEIQGTGVLELTG